MNDSISHSDPHLPQGTGAPKFEVRFLPTLRSLLQEKNVPLIHRDLSWLQFNERVLEEARQSSNPLLERLKFLSISASNLDEFFMIRFASLGRAINAERRKQPTQTGGLRHLMRIRFSLLETVVKFVARQTETLDLLAVELESEGIFIVRRAKAMTSAFAGGKRVFEEQILSKLAPPSALNFQQLQTLDNLQMAAIVDGGLFFKIPLGLASAVVHSDESGHFVFFLDDLLGCHLGRTIYPSAHQRFGTTLLRLTRDAEWTMDFESEDPESIPDLVRYGLGGREKGRAVRLQYAGDLPDGFFHQCILALKLNADQVFPAPDTLCLHGLWSAVHSLSERLAPRPVFVYPTLSPCIPKAMGNSENFFATLKERDFLLHHPYDSFDAFVESIATACKDPNVTLIEQTVYRMGNLSPLIHVLKEAAAHKKVRIVIELRARFDEANNLSLADDLRKAGIEVAYGFGKLKLHAKITLITRNEPNGQKWYTHLSTGNYNASTARQYTDLAVWTANPEIGADARHFFDAIHQSQVPQSFKHLVLAPTRLHRRLLSLIHSEIESAKGKQPARIFAKVNALVDKGVIESLYRASQAGVNIDLVVRGACSIIPGVQGLSENIRVISIVDRFLEHSRIYYFESSKTMYLSSADWMPRNFFSRLEIAFPVLDEKIYSYLQQVVIPTYLQDTLKARELTFHGTWKRRTTRSKTAPIRSQFVFMDLANKSYRGTPLECY